MGKARKAAQSPQKKVAIEDLADVHERCAGIDVHKDSLSVCVIVSSAGTKAEGEVRQFGTTTGQLRELTAWLEQEGVTHVVMESTGVYWRSVWQVLDNNRLQLLLANAKAVKNMPGRKTDRADCIWLATLLRKGLIRGSFIPPAEIRALRDLCRCRTVLVRLRSQTTLRIQKMLEESNIKLDSVLTDVMGVSGRAMLRSLSEGESDPEKLAQLAVAQVRGKTPQLVQALEGTVKPHQRFVLKQWLDSVEELDRHIAEFEKEIDTYAAPFESQIARLDEIPGINRIAAIGVISEIGVDMSVFATAGKLCAWSGLCPGNNETGGKRRRAPVRSGNRWLRGTLTQCAWAASRTKKSYFHAQYRKLVGRCGNNKTLVAVAHSQLEVIWHMLRHDKPYTDLGADYFERRDLKNKQNTYIRKLEQLGFKVTLEPAA